MDRVLANDATARRVDLAGAGGFAAHAGPALVERFNDVVVIVHGAQDEAAAAAAAACVGAGSEGEAAAALAALAAAADGAAFAFVAFDPATRRVVAARGGDAAPDLWWGVRGGSLLVLATEEADVAGCEPTATAFPAGALWASAPPAAVCPGALGFVLIEAGPTHSGTMRSFVSAGDAPPGAPRRFRGVREVPRLDAGGAVCGAVYRVASQGAGLAGLGGPFGLA